MVKKETSVVSFTGEQNIICSQTQLYDIAHEKTIICGHLLAGQVVGSRPMKRKKIWHRMINYFQPLSHEKGVVISDSYGLYFQTPRRLKYFLYYVSEPIVVAKSLLEDIS